MESIGIRPTVLVLEDDPQMAERFASYAKQSGADPLVVHTLPDFDRLLGRRFLPDIGFVDLSLEANNAKDRQGLDAIRKLTRAGGSCYICVLSATITRAEMCKVIRNDWSRGGELRVNDIILKFESPSLAQQRVRELVEQVESRRREHFSDVLRFVVPPNVDVSRFTDEIEQLVRGIGAPGDLRRIFRVAFIDFLPVAYPRGYGRMRAHGRLGVVSFRMWSYRIGRPIIVFIGTEEGVHRLEQKAGHSVFDVRAMNVILHRPGIRVYDARTQIADSTRNGVN